MGFAGLLSVEEDALPQSHQSYLAINGAFSDLGTPGSISVSILTDNGINVASDQDYDPNLSEEDARVESEQAVKNTINVNMTPIV